MLIRHACPGDVTRVQNLSEQGASHYPTPDCGQRDSAKVVLVAEEGQRLVGYLSGVLNGEYAGPARSPGPPHAYLLAVVVTPTEQRRGVGSALVEVFLDHARGAGVRWSFLFPDEGPGVLDRVAFFGRLGYTPLVEPDEPQPAMGRWVLPRSAAVEERPFEE